MLQSLNAIFRIAVTAIDSLWGRHNCGIMSDEDRHWCCSLAQDGVGTLGTVWERQMKPRSSSCGMRLLLFLSILLTSLAWPELASAQESRLDDSGYWLHYSADSDLRANDVRAIAYAEEPHLDSITPSLWIGTDKGLTYTYGGDWERYSIDPTLLVDGRNVLAVEVHQATSASSDMSFDARLSGLVSLGEALLNHWLFNEHSGLHA